MTVEWALDNNGDLLLQWQESGGPIVNPPSRRGFGSTVIEESITYDLGGSAAVDYLPEGFQAQYRIPARHIAGLSMIEAAAQPAAPVIADGVLLAGICVLVLEDNLIIAMDCADTLTDLGAARVMQPPFGPGT